MEITMDNVNVPVMGIASTGQQQMMMPWQQYTFPGADYVDEIPMAQQGLSVNSLVNTPRSLAYNNKKITKGITTLPEIPIHPPQHRVGDSNIENVWEILDPSGFSSYNDVYDSYQKTGMSPQTMIEIVGALPLLGKVGKVTKGLSHLAKTSRQARSLNNYINALKAASLTGRASDTYQAYDQYKVGGIPELPLNAGRRAYHAWGYTNNDFIVNRQEGGGSDVSGYAYNASGEGPALGLGIDYNKNNFSAGIEGEVPLYRNSGYGFNPSLRLGYNIPIGNKLNLNLNASGNLSKEGANPQFGAGLRYSFDEGGYIEAKLTPEEIEEYRAQGYIVEDLPEAQAGLEVFGQMLGQTKKPAPKPVQTVTPKGADLSVFQQMLEHAPEPEVKHTYVHKALPKKYEVTPNPQPIVQPNPQQGFNPGFPQMKEAPEPQVGLTPYTANLLKNRDPLSQKNYYEKPVETKAVVPKVKKLPSKKEAKEESNTEESQTDWKAAVPVVTKGLIDIAVPNNIRKALFDETDHSNKINDYNVKIENIDKKLQDLKYKLGDPKIKDKKGVYESFNKLTKYRGNFIKKINSLKEDEAGYFDTLIQENAPAVVAKAATKYGYVDEISPTKNELPKFETYKEKENREKEEFLTSKQYDNLSPSSSQYERWKFRAAASNDEPLKVKVYGTRGERETQNVDIKSKGAMMHFLDQSPLTGYMHENTKNYYKKLKPDEYLGVLQPDKDGTYAVKYVKKKDYSGNVAKNTFLVRQVDFDDIDFKNKVNDDNFSGHKYWTKKDSPGQVALPVSIGKDANTYDYSSGQSVVYIFDYKGKTRYVHFAGSPNEIKKEGERIKKDYKLENNKLTLGLADAGSYSSAVKGDVNSKKLNSSDYGYVNYNKGTGAGMALIE